MPIEVQFLLFTTITIAILTGAIALFFYGHQQSHQKRQQEYEKEILAAKQEIQELTLQAVARDLHCHINHLLTLARVQLRTIDFNNIPDARRKIIASSELLSESIESIRNISNSLNPTIKGPGLIAALRSEIHILSESGLFTIHDKFGGKAKPLSDEKELLLFRIAQELLNNVLKHSSAREINISLMYLDETVDLIISDNGVGFNYLQYSDTPSGQGLNNIKTRTKMLNAKIDITSVLNQGTSICISVPYN